MCTNSIIRLGIIKCSKLMQWQCQAEKAFKCTKGNFKWASHTYKHNYLHCHILALIFIFFCETKFQFFSVFVFILNIINVCYSAIDDYFIFNWKNNHLCCYMFGYQRWMESGNDDGELRADEKWVFELELDAVYGK